MANQLVSKLREQEGASGKLPQSLQCRQISVIHKQQRTLFKTYREIGASALFFFRDETSVGDVG